MREQIAANGLYIQVMICKKKTNKFCECTNQTLRFDFFNKKRLGFMITACHAVNKYEELPRKDYWS